MMHPILALLLSLALTYGAAWLGARYTAPALREWYPSLKKPAWTPPDWLFGPVWGILYTLMAVAAWLVYLEIGLDRTAIGPLQLYELQLLLNVTWSYVFFRKQNPKLALGVILLLLVAIAVTALAFYQVSPLAGWLMLPYLLWVGFAALLNLAIVRLNP